MNSWHSPFYKMDYDDDSRSLVMKSFNVASATVEQIIESFVKMRINVCVEDPQQILEQLNSELFEGPNFRLEMRNIMLTQSPPL